MNTSGSRPSQALTLPALAVALLVALPAHAQKAEPAKPATGLERAQKAADAVFHWIKLNGEKGASRQNPPPAPPPAPAPAPRKPVTAAPRPAPVAAVVAAPASEAQAAAAPAPAPVIAQAEPEPEPQPVLVASAAPSPTPSSPITAAEQATEPPPAPAEPAEVPLRLISKVEPVIPRQLQQQSFSKGFAQVQFTVSTDGSVRQVQVLKASHTRLGMAAVDAVKQWRFAPIPQPREAAVEVAFSTADE